MIVSVYSINRANEVVNCIESLKKQTLLPKEIVVVLDPDETLVSYYKKRLDLSVKLVVSDAFGLSAARNKGIKSSDSELIAFIDDDAVADSNWLFKIVEAFNDPSVLGVSGEIKPFWIDEIPVWLPRDLNWIIGCSYNELPVKKGPVRNPFGCNMSFRRNVFNTVGYFNTHVGRIGNNLLGHEDTELAVRARRKFPQMNIIYDPEAFVYHIIPKHRATISYLVRRSFHEGYSKFYFVKQLKNNKDVLTEESTYLNTVISKRIPKMLTGSNMPNSIFQVIALSISTVCVLFGYASGKIFIDQTK